MNTVRLGNWIAQVQKWVCTITDESVTYGPMRVKGADVRQAAYRAVRLVVAKRGKDLTVAASIVINPQKPKIILLK